jgi:lipopolysaccharide transport system ATP-binding protein
MRPAIRVSNLSKRYRLGLTHAGSIRELVGRATDRLLARRHEPLPYEHSAANGNGRQIDEYGNFWALKDVSFEVQAGEVLGIIGRNGAGKSTLLKIFSRITAPTFGRVEIYGRVASLLEVGTGFHPELTGRENVFLNGAILGMTKAEIRRRFDEIVAFAEVEKFLDTPVKRYSNGMYVRLAFAVAAHLEPDILVVDEVLSVGDVDFQRKCLGKMSSVSKEGRTVLFVSHNLPALQHFCPRAVLLHEGRTIKDGHCLDVIAAYLARNNKHIEGKSLGTPQPNQVAAVRLVQVDILDERDNATNSLLCGGNYRFVVQLESPLPLDAATLLIAINDESGTRITQLCNAFRGQRIAICRGQSRIVCSVRHFPLSPNAYRTDVKLLAGNELLLDATDVLPFSVVSGDFFRSGRLPDPQWAGIVQVPHDWDTRNCPVNVAQSE